MRPLNATALAFMGITALGSASARVVLPADGPFPEASGSQVTIDLPDASFFNVVQAGSDGLDIEETHSGSDGGTSTYRINMAGGEIGASLQNPDAPDGNMDGLDIPALTFGFTSVVIYETLEFDFGPKGSGNVSYSLSTDGTLFSNEDEFGFALAYSTIGLIDISGVDNPVEFDSDLESLTLSDELDPDETVFEDASGSAILGSAYTDSEVEDTFDVGINQSFAPGSQPQDFAQFIDGSFAAETGRTYFLVMTLFLVVGGNDPSVVDTLGTSTFALTDLGGSTVTTGTGVFLQDTLPGAEIPVPGALLLVAPFVAGAAMRRVSKVRTSI